MITTYAQSLVEYNWSHTGISFKVPENTEIISNTPYDFQVDNEYFNVALVVFEDLEAEPEFLGKMIVELAEDKGLIIDADTEIQTFDNTGCWGISIEGDREDDALCCAFIVSKEKDLIVLVTVNYGHGFEEEANDIINSIVME